MLRCIIRYGLPGAALCVSSLLPRREPVDGYVVAVDQYQHPISGRGLKHPGRGVYADVAAGLFPEIVRKQLCLRAFLGNQVNSFAGVVLRHESDPRAENG
ncbi:hypothetical protein GCM10022228_04170 [Halomonas cibimaris]|uniref:Uncharacterized protein n=1 Tax=Halomonas cibimaris TaxID=657012 RepID=A0ABP7L995_9GAMM